MICNSYISGNLVLYLVLRGEGIPSGSSTEGCYQDIRVPLGHQVQGKEGLESLLTKKVPISIQGKLSDHKGSLQ